MESSATTAAVEVQLQDVVAVLMVAVRLQATATVAAQEFEKVRAAAAWMPMRD